MDAEKINKLKWQIATQLLTWTRLNQHDLKIEFVVPPTREQVIKEYRNSPMFHNVVDSMVYGIVDIVEREEVGPHCENEHKAARS